MWWVGRIDGNEPRPGKGIFIWQHNPVPTNSGCHISFWHESGVGCMKVSFIQLKWHQNSLAVSSVVHNCNHGVIVMRSRAVVGTTFTGCSWNMLQIIFMFSLIRIVDVLCELLVNCTISVIKWCLEMAKMPWLRSSFKMPVTLSEERHLWHVWQAGRVGLSAPRVRIWSTHTKPSATADVNMQFGE